MSSNDFDALVAQLKAGAPDLNREAWAVRADFHAMMTAFRVDDSVVQHPQTLNGVPCIRATGPWSDPQRLLLYVHGGAYVFGSASDYLPLATALARNAGTRLCAVDYRLAPEHPYPAALDDVLQVYRALLEEYPAERIVVAGDSAGGGLSVALLVAARDAGLALPAAAVLLSPWADLALEGASLHTRAADDYLLNAQGLARMARYYVGDESPRAPMISPIHADLTGLPPLLIQVGSHEILLSDALRLTDRAALADAAVELQVWPRMFHVWQLFDGALRPSTDALEQAGRFLGNRLAACAHQPSAQ